MKILSMKTSLSSPQKPNKLALQPIKACKTFGHFQLESTKYCAKKYCEIQINFHLICILNGPEVKDY